MKSLSASHYFLTQPVFLLYLFSAGCYLSPSINISKFFIITIAGMFLLKFDSVKYAQLLKQHIGLMLFLGFTVISAFWGDIANISYPLKSAIFILSFVLFICRYKENINRHINTVFAVIYISAGVLSIILLVIHFKRYGIDFETRMDKLYGPIIQTIKTASILSLALIIMIWHIAFKPGWHRVVALFLLMPTVMAILLLKSRGATLSIGVGLAALYFAKNLRAKHILLSLGKSLSLLLLLAGAGLWFFLHYDNRELSDSFRFVIWQSSLYQVYEENIVAGIGYIKDQNITALDGQVYDHSHNFLVSLLRITGFVGLILFCTYIFQSLKYFLGRYNNQDEQALVFAWLVMSFATLFFNGNYPVYFKPDIFILLWMPVALLWVFK